MTPLHLYSTEYCPYCWRVRSAAEELGIELRILDTSRDPQARQHLVSRLGRATVPVLGFECEEGERLLPESRDIIRFLEQLSNEGRFDAPCAVRWTSR